MKSSDPGLIYLEVDIYSVLSIAQGDFTTCWPKDWLGEDIGTSIRVIGVDYPSNTSYWQRHCPYSRDKQTILEQAKVMLERLHTSRVGAI